MHLALIFIIVYGELALCKARAGWYGFVYITFGFLVHVQPPAWGARIMALDALFMV